MITFLLLLLLIFSFYEGARRGTALQLVYFIGFSISFFVAEKYCQPVGEKLELIVPYLSVSPETKMALYSQQLSFDLDKTYYAGIAFLGILTIGWLITKFLGILSSGLRFFGGLPYQWIFSGLVNVLMTYCVLFLIAFLFTTIPLGFIQARFEQGSMLRGIVEHTPFLSETFRKLWITDLIR